MGQGDPGAGHSFRVIGKTTVTRAGGFLSERVGRIKVSPSNAGAQRVRELRAAGRDIIGLTIGEPDFETPAHVKAAAAAAMEREETKYTNVDGTPELKAAIRAKFKRENGLDYEPDQILVGNGGKQVIYNALMATVSAGDEVVIPAPYWVSYVDIPLLADGTPVIVTCRPEDGFKITPAALEAAITPRTKWFIVNSPCNPTGAVYSRAELKALAGVLLRHPHVRVIADDIYEHLVFDGIEFATLAQVEPALYERTLTVNGVSKAYAMTGWRIGFCGGPKDLVRNMAKIQSQTTTNACSISQAAAIEALEGPQDFVPARARAFQERRDRVLELLREAPGIRCFRPDGAFYIFGNCAGMLGRRTPGDAVLETEADAVDYLLESGGVALVVGAAYGLSPWFRMSIASPMDELAEACRRIRAAAAALR
ncbi:MAG: aminotransferase class I/II-fold pyridoxal phosphate-dependent enzyme [Burkholderiales bacterium]|nr:aminotransferase class I/II-fold pyridoxal phosphate-dependent enzyme [Burkholderiales bacterium]